MELDKKTFNDFRALIYEKSGITLSPQKESLVATRIGKRIRTLGDISPKDYFKLIVSDDTGEELVALLDAISTNVTSFFREAEHFTVLAEKLKEWYFQGQRKFRIWCAASSTGEEPYTIAMTCAEALDLSQCDIKILATDISTKVLKQASDGLYRLDKLQGIPLPLRNKWFSQTPDREYYQVHPTLRQMLTFKRLNLSQPPFPMKGPTDIIFCRNVMIYFDNIVRKALLTDCYRILKNGGVLLVGHAESLTGMVSDFKLLRPSVYGKVGGTLSVIVDISDFKVTNDPNDVLVTYSLGSCIGVSIYDPEACVGGMIHFMLPFSKVDLEKAKSKPAMFADTGLPALLQAIYNLGAQRKNLIVKVAEGSRILDDKGIFNIGERNYTVMRKVFWKNDILIKAEDVGGTKARTV